MQLDMRQNITICLQETLLATSNATTHVLAPTPPILRRRGGPARRSLPLAVDSPKRRTASPFVDLEGYRCGNQEMPTSANW
jgi:hypothetical protein